MKVPNPGKLSSGIWFCQVMVDGQRVSITESTKQLCKDKALLLKAHGRTGTVQLHKPTQITLSQAIDNYILLRSNVLSPSTLSGYRDIQRQRFKSVMQEPISSVSSWQAVVNNESAIVSAKTVKNAWSLAHSALVSSIENIFRGM